MQKKYNELVTKEGKAGASAADAKARKEEVEHLLKMIPKKSCKADGRCNDGVSPTGQPWLNVVRNKLPASFYKDLIDALN